MGITNPLHAAPGARSTAASPDKMAANSVRAHRMLPLRRERVARVPTTGSPRRTASNSQTPRDIYRPPQRPTYGHRLPRRPFLAYLQVQPSVAKKIAVAVVHCRWKGSHSRFNGACLTPERARRRSMRFLGSPNAGLRASATASARGHASEQQRTLRHLEYWRISAADGEGAPRRGGNTPGGAKAMRFFRRKERRSGWTCGRCASRSRARGRRRLRKRARPSECFRRATASALHRQ